MAEEPPAWAFLSALGAGFLVSVAVELTVFVVYPILFPPTREQPSLFVPGRVLWEAAGALAAGAVATRAGGLRALVFYLFFELANFAAMMPAISYSCRFSAGLGFERAPCDFGSLLASHWYLWLAIAVGAAASRAIEPRGQGSNDVLRAGGALAAAIAVGLVLGSLLLFLVILPNSHDQLLGIFGLSDVSIYFYAAGNLVGGLLAGTVLARRGVAAPLLLALGLVAPSFASGVPLWRGQTGTPPGEPLLLLLGRFSWFWVPSLAVLALFITWAVARRRARGTFS